MGNKLGELIKELRIKNQLSQNELAKGICTQALISKVEKGETIPSIDIFKQLAKRLNVPLDYIIKRMDYLNYDYIDELYYQIRRLLRERNYTEIYSLVLSEKRSPSVSNMYHKQFLMWQEGICLYHINKDMNSSLSILHQALDLIEGSEGNIERTIEILNSIGVIYFEEQQYHSALTQFEEAIHLLEHSILIQDQTIFIKVYYNHAKVLTRLNSHEQSIHFCNKGLQRCLHMESNYLLGELYYHKGYNLRILDRSQESIAEFEKSIALFEIQSQHDFAEAALEQIKMNRIQSRTINELHK